MPPWTGGGPHTALTISTQLWVYVSQNYFFNFTSVSALESLKGPSDDFLDTSPELEDYKKKFFFQTLELLKSVTSKNAPRCFL